MDAEEDPPVEPIITEVEDPVVKRARSCDDRRWLERLTAIVEAYSREPDRPKDVQDALDSTVIAALARMRRIIRRDWPAG